MTPSLRLIAIATLLLGAAPVPVALPTASLFASADPDSEVIDGQLWIFPTGERGDRLIAWSSTDLGHWRMRGTLIRQSDIGWIKADGAKRHYLWAPDMVAAADRWLLYYSVGPQNPTPSRIGVATCATPQGPCVDSGKPLLSGGNGFEAIDPMVFADPRSGMRYLYAGGSAGAKLRVFVLAADQLTIDHEVTVDQPPYFTEGVFMHERGGVYYLSYSHGNWQAADYSVHYATAPSPTGPWRYRGVLLSSDAHYKGPGHHSFIGDPRGDGALIVYHRWEHQAGDGPYRGERRVAVAPLTYAPDGTIVPVRMSR